MGCFFSRLCKKKEQSADPTKEPTTLRRKSTPKVELREHDMLEIEMIKLQKQIEAVKKDTEVIAKEIVKLEDAGNDGTPDHTNLKNKLDRTAANLINLEKTMDNSAILLAQLKLAHHSLERQRIYSQALEDIRRASDPSQAHGSGAVVMNKAGSLGLSKIASTEEIYLSTRTP